MRWLRNRSLPLLVTLVGLLALNPLFVSGGVLADNLFPILMIIAPLFGLVALSSWKHAIPLGILFVSMFVYAVFKFHLDQFEIEKSGVAYLVWVYYLYVIFALANAMLRNTSLIDDRVYGGLSIYLLTAMMFGSVHRHVSAINPIAYCYSSTGKPIQFAWDEALYFSVSTITTVGYGDIVPASTWARCASMLEAISGVVITIVFIARLASLAPGNAKKH